jgi:uncharacterized protein (TIGR02646 family)
MADIKLSIEYTDPQKKLVATKIADTEFSHKNWDGDDLRELRKAIRNYYKIEQKARCSYCRNPVSLTSVLNCHVEHIAPKSKYRDFIFEPKNLCVICADCNAIKREQETLGLEPDTVKNGNRRTRYPRSSDAFKIVHPHFDNYEDHIEIFAGQFYADKTLKGGHTILYCKLNRRLHAFGWRREFIENSIVSKLMNKYLEEKDPFKGHQLLNELAKLLILNS